MVNRDNIQKEWQDRYKEIQVDSNKTYEEKILPKISPELEKFLEKAIISEISPYLDKLHEQALYTGIAAESVYLSFSIDFWYNEYKYEIYSYHSRVFFSKTLEDNCILTREALEKAIENYLSLYNITVKFDPEKQNYRCYPLLVLEEK